MNRAQEHNKRRGAGLSVLVMDHLRAQQAKGEAVTLWSLNRSICERFELTGRERNAQYSATRTVVRNLEDAGMIASRKEWDKTNERFLKYLLPCLEK